MGPSNEDIIKAILHYQEKLEKYNANKSEDKMLYALRKLSKLPIKTSHLESTGVGRTVNALKKLTGAVGDSAKNLVMSWKEMVLEEEKATQETSIETEEDADSVYSSENESQDLQMEEGKENVNNQSDSESDSEDYSYKKEIPSKNQNYLENKTSKYKDHKKHDNYSSTNSNSDDDDDEAETNSRFRKREHSTDSSSDERGRHKSKKSKRESESSSRHHYKDKYTKDEKDKKHDRHSSSSKSKNNEDRSESKHKPKRESEQSNHKLEKYSKHEEKDKKSSHSSKHKSSSSHSSKKESKDKKDKHESKRESSSSHSSEKKLKESSKEEKKKSKESHSGSNSQSKDKSTNGENGVKKEKKEKVKSISKEKIINGIDSESGASFAEALGMCGPVSSQSIKKKTSSTDKKSVKPVETKPSESSRNSSKTSKHEESSSSSSSRPVPELLAEEPREPLNICLSSLLPEITPNYKPTPINLDSQSKRVYNDDEALSRVMSNKNQRTKVYSGNKTVGKVESLFQICVRILQDNIDALEYTGGVPFLILKPILDRATPDQLFNMEHHNPYLIEDTDDLWQLHCQKEFRNKKREELESWREMYMRCLDEREARLSFITANIKQSQDKSEPVRTTKLAYVDSGFVKPPRNIARKQAKNGTVTTDRKITPTQKLSVIAKSGDTEKIAHPNPSSRATERTSNSSSAATKPKKAPLMAKTLSFLKNRFKR